MTGSQQSDAGQPTQPEGSKNGWLREYLKDKTDLTALAVAFLALCGVLITAGSAFAGSYIAAQKSGDQAREIQKNEIAEEQKKLTREKRDGVYLRYAAATREYLAAATEGTSLTYDPSDPNAKVPRPSKAKIAKVSRRIEEKREAHTQAFHALLPYASDEAWNAAKGLQDALLGIDPGEDITFDGNEFARIEYARGWRSNLGKYTINNRKFEAVMCKELSPIPRQGCSGETPRIIN